MPPDGTLGELVSAARVRAAALVGRTAELRRAVDSSPAGRSLRSEIRASTVGIIAELKRASPSRGAINLTLGAAEQARAYERGGAVAISVLTEPSRFGGKDEDLLLVRSAVDLPILKKDFHVEPVQLLEARALGSSAALVIARAVPPGRLAEMLHLGREIGLEILVEVRDVAELDLAISLGAELIGVNNRNLETLAVDLSTTDRVVPQIPRPCSAVAESGIETRADVERAAANGADAVLIGAALSGAADPETALRALTGVPRLADARKN